MNQDDSDKQGERIVVRVDPDLEDLIPGFLEHRREEIKSILADLEQGDFESVTQTGHTMKGVGAGYGFDAVTDIGRRIQEAGEKEDAVEIRRQATELTEYLDQVEIVIESEE
jgi:HPt (histidine-containing phosphotransfer) domain-containing protein